MEYSLKKSIKQIKANKELYEMCIGDLAEKYRDLFKAWIDEIRKMYRTVNTISDVEKIWNVSIFFASTAHLFVWYQ